MKAVLSEPTKQDLLNLAGSLNDMANDIRRQVRVGEVWTHDFNLWMDIKKLIEE